MSLRNALDGICLVLLSLPLNVSATAGTVEGPGALCVGEEVTYTRSGLPDPMSGYPYIWSSSDPSKVAVIDADAGTFEGKALSLTKGDVTITVDDTLGNSASKSVTVVELKRIKITAGGSGNSDDNNSAGNAAPVCADASVTFEAIMDLIDVGGSGVEWSVLQPGGVWQSQGSGKTIELTLAPPDNYEVKAECGSKSFKIFVVSFKVELEPLAAGNTPELTDGRICINAQAAYKKAKWKTIVKPSGTATVTPVSGGVTVTGGYGLSDGDTFWVDGGTTVGDYQIKITHDSLATCIATDGEKVFNFVKEEAPDSYDFLPNSASPTGLDDFAWQKHKITGSETKAGPPNYVTHARNVNGCTDTSIDFENIADQTTWYECGGDFGVKLHATLGVKTDPAGCYSGEVNTKITATTVGNSSEQNGTAWYWISILVDGTSALLISEPTPGSWNDSDNTTKSVTCGAKDGEILIKAHSCTQRATDDPAYSAGVAAEHTVDLSDFEITTP